MERRRIAEPAPATAIAGVRDIGRHNWESDH